MSIVDRLDRLQRRHPIAGYPIAVAYKFFDDTGGYLAALLTYYAFVSLFPILLLLATILSVVLRNNPELQERIINSALSQVPVVGAQIGDPRSLSGGTRGVIVGLLVSIYGALGVGNALQYAMNTIWSIQRNRRPNPFLARARSMLLILTAGVAVVLTTGISTFGAATTSWPTLTKITVILATFVLNTAIILLCYRIGVGSVSPRKQLPGAIVAAIGWQLLQTFGVVYVGRVVNRASASNGVVAFVLGLLAFVYLAAVLIVLCAEINVVHAERLYPRALLTPFIEDVSLTEADKETYADQARATRHKDFENVEVTFDNTKPPP